MNKLIQTMLVLAWVAAVIVLCFGVVLLLEGTR